MAPLAGIDPAGSEAREAVVTPGLGGARFQWLGGRRSARQGPGKGPVGAFGAVLGVPKTPTLPLSQPGPVAPELGETHVTYGLGERAPRTGVAAWSIPSPSSRRPDQRAGRDGSSGGDLPPLEAAREVCSAAETDDGARDGARPKGLNPSRSRKRPRRRHFPEAVVTPVARGAQGGWPGEATPALCGCDSSRRDPGVSAASVTRRELGALGAGSLLKKIRTGRCGPAGRHGGWRASPRGPGAGRGRSPAGT